MYMWYGLIVIPSNVSWPNTNIRHVFGQIYVHLSTQGMYLMACLTAMCHLGMSIAKIICIIFPLIMTCYAYCEYIQAIEAYISNQNISFGENFDIDWSVYIYIYMISCYIICEIRLCLEF